MLPTGRAAARPLLISAGMRLLGTFAGVALVVALGAVGCTGGDDAGLAGPANDTANGPGSSASTRAPGASSGDADADADAGAGDSDGGQTPGNGADGGSTKRDGGGSKDGGTPVVDSGPPPPTLNAFWNNAVKLSAHVHYLSKDFVRPSTNTPTPIHALAIDFSDAASTGPSFVVSGDRPCAGEYCTADRWAHELATLPTFAVNGDYFQGVDYGTGVGSESTDHLWMSHGNTVDPGLGPGGVLSSTGPKALPSLTLSGNLPSGTVDAIGGRWVTSQTTGVPANGDYYAARTVSGTDGVGFLFIVVAEGFDHAQGVSGPGLNMPDEWELMTRLGATKVVNHDGGGSSQLFIAGKGLVYPSSSPRFVANLFGVQD